MKVSASDLRELSDEEFNKIIQELGPDLAEELLYNWKFWARPDQLEPPGRYKIWMPLAGRGWGKTRTGAETVRDWVKQGLQRIACVAPTKGDVRRVMVEGQSGLMAICSKNDKTNRGAEMGYPIWSPTNNTITWRNGAKAEFFSAEDPERLRGPQFHAAWCDELAAWRNMQETWDMLQFTLRLGRNPKILVTTTPKPLKLIRHIIALSKEDPEKYVVTTGTSFDNKDNIDLDALSAYEGTRLGRQELYAEVLEEAAGALWTIEMIDSCQVYPEDVDIEHLTRIVVAVDPAVTNNSESDMTGIVVAGLDVNGHGVVIEDATDQLSPSGWASKAVELYHKYGADRIVAERNQGGEMVRHTIETEDNTVPIRLVHASRGKFARAEPVSALYEQGRVKHLPGLDELEQQMVTWEPLGSMGSPDRLDALVWAITDLMLGGIMKPTLKLSYETKAESKNELALGY